MKQNKKIVIIGSTQYHDRIILHKEYLELEGYEVLIPAFDDHPAFDELQVCEYNRSLIEKADEVHMIWDGRSIGTWGDFCMAFALKKIVEIIFIEPKSIRGVIEKYTEKCKKENMSSMS